MHFFNAIFQPSTIRPDDSIQGAILVDSVLLRESELKYDDESQYIPEDSIKNQEFINALNGLLVFNEHPRDMVSADIFNEIIKNSIGTIFNAHYDESNGDKRVVGTLRISNPDAIEEIKNKSISGGSLGYFANICESNGKKIQVNLKPNHFCITKMPRDDGVKLLNSNKGVNIMDKAEIQNIVKEFMNAQNADLIQIKKEDFNAFMQTIQSRIEDKSVVSVLNSKPAESKMRYLDSVLSVKNIFNSETSSQNEDLKKENEDLKKENEDLKKELESLKAKKDDDSKKEGEPVNNGEGDDPKKDDDSKKEGEPVNNGEGDCDDKKQSVTNSYVGFNKVNDNQAKSNADLNARLSTIL